VAFADQVGLSETFNVHDFNGGMLLSNDLVAIRTSKGWLNGHTIQVGDINGSDFGGAGREAQYNFRIVKLGGVPGDEIHQDDKIALLLNNTGKYLRAFNGGGGDVDLSDNLGPWEEFTINGNGLKIPSIYTVAFRTEANLYFSAQPSGELFADRTARGEWENFTLIDLNQNGILTSGEVVYLKGSYNTYWSAEGGGGSTINVNRDAASVWEEFTILNLPLPNK